MFSLLLVWTNYSTNNRVVTDLRRHDAHVTWRHCSGAMWRCCMHMMLLVRVNIESGNGLLLDTPLPELMLTCRRSMRTSIICFTAFTLANNIVSGIKKNQCRNSIVNIRLTFSRAEFLKQEGCHRDYFIITCALTNIDLTWDYYTVTVVIEMTSTSINNKTNVVAVAPSQCCVPFHKSHNASDKYPTMHHFVTEMCTCVHISVTKWCIVGYGTGALWDGSI